MNVRVAVLGDYQIDVFRWVDHKPVKPDPTEAGTTNIETPEVWGIPNHGGALFLDNFISAALDEIPKGRNSVKTLTYSVSEVFRSAVLSLESDGEVREGYRVPETEWQLKHRSANSRAGGKNEKKVLRLVHPQKIRSVYPDSRWYQPEFPAALNSNEPFDVLVIDDLGMMIRNLSLKDGPSIARRLGKAPTWEMLQQDYAKRLTSLLDQLGSQRGSRLPWIVITLGAGLPDLKAKESLWHKLHNDEVLRDRVIVVMNAHDLRDEGIDISTSLSWERSAESVIAEMHLHPRLKEFRAFRHVVIRFGVTGAFHFWRRPHQEEYALHYSPRYGDSDYADPETDGLVIGHNSVMAARIVQELVKGRLSKKDAHVNEAIDLGISSCFKHFCHGYGKYVKDADEFKEADNAMYFAEEMRLVSKGLFQLNEVHDPDFTVSKVAIPSAPSPYWSILREKCRFQSESIAQKIVQVGPVKTLTSYDLNASKKQREESPITPIAIFDRAVLVDRTEIESFRMIRNAIERHMERVHQKKADRPLNIGVFGPPGSGKSFGVKNVVNSMPSGDSCKIITFNVAQFSSHGDLDTAFKSITDEMAGGKVPVVFWDEFDSKCGEQDLGWLKYFLAPMEDGIYRDSPVRDAIFIFAGGTSTKFTDFTREDPSVDDQQVLRFSEAKGPDFVSRLRGHVDILGINPSRADDDAYLIRRAVVLRGFLSDEQRVKEGDPVEIDPDILRALLHVSEYKHGARSMRTVLTLCMNKTGYIRKSSMPTVAQLNMHVDGNAFLKIVNRVEGRYHKSFD